MVSASRAVVPYDGAYGNKLFPTPEIGSGMDEVNENHIREDDILPAPSPDSLEVGEVTSQMVHMG